MTARHAVGPAVALAFALAQPVGAATTSSSCEPRDLAALAGWSGVWAAEDTNAVGRGIGGQFGGSEDYPLAGLNAPWNDEGWARMAAMLRLAGAPNLKLPIWGFPMMMASFAELTFVIAPAETVIVNQQREIRSIYTDGRGHMPADELWATNWGDSTGCWEGDTLVIDTVGVRYDRNLSAFAPPLSEQAHFVERLRLVTPGRIENQVTITDPAYLTAPWTARIAYVPAGIDRLVQDAYEDRIDGDALTITAPADNALVPLPLPANAKLSAAELDRVAGRYVLDAPPVELAFERQGDRLYFQPPGFNGLLPMFARDSLNFTVIDGSTMRFVADASGKVVGLEAARPDGASAKGTRK